MGKLFDYQESWRAEGGEGRWEGDDQAGVRWENPGFGEGLFAPCCPEGLDSRRVHVSGLPQFPRVCWTKTQPNNRIALRITFEY